MTMPTEPDGDPGHRAGNAPTRGALLGTFLGDALGARWEGAGTADSWHEGRHRLERSAAQEVLAYTDDTQMMLALADHLLSYPDVEVDALARSFADHYEPGRGYGGGTVRVLQAVRAGLPVDRAARAGFPDGSLGNGAAMRAAPVGVLLRGDRQRLLDAARRSALPTHVHREGIDGAVLIAVAVGRAADHGRFDAPDLQALARTVSRDLGTGAMRRHVGAAAALARDTAGAGPPPRQVADALGVSATAARSTGTALWVAATAVDARDAVARALALGGDADTIAAMATAVVGAAGGDTALPGEWKARAESGDRGIDWCTALADRLAAARPPGTRA